MESDQVTVERMIPGGKGIAFLEKKAVFLPLVVPGDRIRIRQAADRGSYLEVLDSELVQASPDRQQPPCPYFGRCGGCDFQQMNPRRQLDSKAEILTDALHHVGRIRGAESRIVLNPSPGHSLPESLAVEGAVPKWESLLGIFRTGLPPGG